MSSPIGSATSGAAYPLASAQGTTSAGSATSGSSTDMMSSLSSNDFLKLLVTQLQYQDPDSPADPSQFMAQTAQLTEVDKLNSIATQQSQLLATDLSIQAAGLVGKTVNYRSAAGDLLSGTVTSTTFGTSPTLRIGNTDIPLSSVTGIGQ